VFLLSLLPAEIYVGLSGNTRAGIVVYGLLFYLAPLAGLIGHFRGRPLTCRIIFVYACGSTALLCPLVFGFPTEMWLAHALFWPALAVSIMRNEPSLRRHSFSSWCFALAFTHEGALVWHSPSLRTLATARLARCLDFCARLAILVAVLAMSAAAKILMPPDEYLCRRAGEGPPCTSSISPSFR